MKNQAFTNPFFWLYAVLFGAIPFISSNLIFDPVLMPRQHLLAGFVALSALLIFASKGLKFSFKKGLVLTNMMLLFWLTFNLVSSFYAFNTADAYYTLSKVFLILGFFVLTQMLFVSDKLNRNHLYWLFVIIGFCSLITIALDAKEIGFIKGIGAFHKTLKGAFANPNLAASILFMIMSGIWIFKPKNAFNLLSGTLSLFCLIFIYLIGTKSAIFGVLLALASYFSLHFFAKSKYFKQVAIAFISALVLFSVSIVALSDNENIRNFLGNDARFKLNTQTLLMVKDEPLKGVGTGNWRLFLPKYGLEMFGKPFQDGISHYQRPHNEFLTAFSELGIFGGFSWLIFWLTLFFYAYRKAIKDDESDYYIRLMSFFIGFWIISFLDFPLERIEHNVLFFTCIAALLVKEVKRPEQVKNKKKPLVQILPKSQPITRSLALAFLLVSGVSYFIISERMESEAAMFVIQTKPNGPEKSALLLSQPPKAINTFFSVDPTSAPVFYYSGLGNFMAGNYESATKEFEKAAMYHPYHIHVLNGIGAAYQKLGNFEKSAENFKKSLAISPTFSRSSLNLAILYIENNKYEELINLLLDSPFLSPSDNNVKALMTNGLAGFYNDYIKEKSDLPTSKTRPMVQKIQNNAYGVFKEMRSSEHDFKTYLDEYFHK